MTAFPLGHPVKVRRTGGVVTVLVAWLATRPSPLYVVTCEHGATAQVHTRVAATATAREPDSFCQDCAASVITMVHRS